MHRIALTYSLNPDRSDTRDLHHPLMAMLEAIHASGSISAAARTLSLSYRHVWGELKRWEHELGQQLVIWAKGQRAQLSPFGEKLLWAERRARARLAPQIESLRGELERAFAVAFDDNTGVIPVYASHDDALARLRDHAAARKLHLDIQFTGSVDALAALNEGRCLLAGFHALVDAPLRSPTARVYRPMLKPGRHKLIGFAQRWQGLMVAPGNPLALQGLPDLLRDDLRFANRQRGTGSRVVLEELLAAQKIDPSGIATFDQTEPSMQAVAEAVVSGRADAAFGTQAVAVAKGLDFIALAREHYFLVGLAGALDHPHVRQLMGMMQSGTWQRELLGITGYEPERSGEVLALRRVLPWWTYRTPKASSRTET